jgi:hypothetical protein
MGLFVTFAGVLVSLVFRFCVYYLRVMSSIEYKLYDVLTVSCTDYTVQVEIPESLWVKWLDVKSDLSFKEYMKEEIER